MQLHLKKEKEGILKELALATNLSEEDFLLTHEPFKELEIINRNAFVQMMEDHLNLSNVRYVNEDIFLENYLLSDYEKEKDRFYIMNGNPGTGKSHLIRWFEIKYRQKKKNTVVCFISKNNNTLYSALQCILDSKGLPQDIREDELKKLKAAQDVTNSDSIESEILGKLFALCRDEENDGKIDIPGIQEFVTSKHVGDKILCSDDGPIKRIINRLGNEKNQTSEEFDEIFESKMFHMTEEHPMWDEYQEHINEYGNAVKLILKNCEKLDYAAKISQVFNSMVDKVIQQSIKLSDKELQNIFSTLKCRLKEEGLELALFIEDVTVLNGLDIALLDILAKEKEERWCPVTSIIGITPSYYNKNIPGYYEDRAGAIFMIDKDFDFNHIDSEEQEQKRIERLCSFVARYLQLVCEPSEDVNAADEYFHVPVSDSSGYEMSVSIYPFTKQMLLNLYRYLKPENQNPRRFLENVFLKLMNTFKNQVVAFPFIKGSFSELSFNLPIYRKLERNISESNYPDDKEKLLMLLLVYGDLENKNGNEVFGIHKEVFDMFGMTYPLELFQKTGVVAEDADIKEISTYERVEESVYKKCERQIRNWYEKEETLTISESLINVLANMIKGYFDWNSLGYPLVLVNARIRKELIGIEGAGNKRAKPLELERSEETRNILLGINEFLNGNNSSWDYDGGWYDLSCIYGWIENNSEQIFNLMLSLDQKNVATLEQMKYGVLTLGVVNLAFTGEIKEFSLANIYKIYQGIFRRKISYEKELFFCEETENLIDLFQQKLLDKKVDKGSLYQALLNLFYLSQGSDSKKLFFDALSIIEMLQTIISKGNHCIETYLKPLCCLSNQQSAVDPLASFYDLVEESYAYMANFTDAEVKRNMEYYMKVKTCYPLDEYTTSTSIQKDIVKLDEFFVNMKDNKYTTFQSYEVNFEEMNRLCKQDIYELLTTYDTISNMLEEAGYVSLALVFQLTGNSLSQKVKFVANTLNKYVQLLDDEIKEAVKKSSLGEANYNNLISCEEFVKLDMLKWNLLQKNYQVEIKEESRFSEISRNSSLAQGYVGNRIEQFEALYHIIIKNNEYRHTQDLLKSIHDTMDSVLTESENMNAWNAIRKSYLQKEEWLFPAEEVKINDCYKYGKWESLLENVKYLDSLIKHTIRETMGLWDRKKESIRNEKMNIIQCFDMVALRLGVETSQKMLEMDQMFQIIDNWDIHQDFTEIKNEISQYRLKKDEIISALGVDEHISRFLIKLSSEKCGIKDIDSAIKEWLDNDESGKIVNGKLRLRLDK